MWRGRGRRQGAGEEDPAVFDQIKFPAAWTLGLRGKSRVKARAVWENVENRGEEVSDHVGRMGWERGSCSDGEVGCKASACGKGRGREKERERKKELYVGEPNRVDAAVSFTQGRRSELLRERKRGARPAGVGSGQENLGEGRLLRLRRARKKKRRDEMESSRRLAALGRRVEVGEEREEAEKGLGLLRKKDRVRWSGGVRLGVNKKTKAKEPLRALQPFHGRRSEAGDIGRKWDFTI